MSKAKNNTVTLRILERDYQFSSPEQQEEQLAQAARFLDTRMKEIRNSGRVVGTERIAVMAALNLAFELLFGDDNSDKTSVDKTRLSQLSLRIEEVLANESQMELT